MIFKKRSNDERLKKLSDNALLFIKKYAMDALHINQKIDDDIACDILHFACQCELNMVDSEGKDRTEDYPQKERDILGDAYVTEVSDYLIDLDDLNNRLGLI